MNITKKISQKLLLLYLFLLPWQTLIITREIFVEDVKWQYATMGIYITQIIFWLAIIFFIISQLSYLKNRYSLHNKQIIKIFISQGFPARLLRAVLMVQAIIIFMIIRNMFSKDVFLGLQHLMYIEQGFVFVLFLLVSGISKKQIMETILFGAIIPSLIGLLQFISQSSLSNAWLGLTEHPVLEAGSSVVVSEFSGRVLRSYATFAHPNVMGGYIAIVIMSYLFLVKGEFEKKYLSIFLLLSATLFTTFSRSAWLAVAAILLLHLPKIHFTERVKPLIKIFILVFVVFSFFNKDLVQTRTHTASSKHEIASVTERIDGVGKAITIFNKNWKYGVGAGQYTRALQMYYPYKPIWEYQPVHSAALLFLVEHGVVVAIMILIFLISVLQILEIISLQAMRDFIIMLVALSPIILFDHYVYSSYIGLMLVSLIVGIYLLQYQQQIKAILQLNTNDTTEGI